MADCSSKRQWWSRAVLALLGLRDARGDGAALAIAGLELGEGFADAGVAKAAYMPPADLTG